MVRGCSQPGASGPALIRPLVALVLAVVAPAASAERAHPRIEGLTCRAGDAVIEVGFDVRDAWGERQLERLGSGVAVVFRHRIELRVSRGLLLPDRVLARTVAETSVEFDALTRRYAVTRTVVWRRGGDGEPPPPVEVRRTFDTLDDVREFTTRVEDVALQVSERDLADPRAVVRVDSTLERRWAWYLVPTTTGATGRCDPGAP